MKKRKNRYAMALASVILAVAVTVVAFVGYQFVSQWVTLRNLNAQKATLTAQLNDLNGKNDGLKKDIEESTTDSFIERMARELLGWVKPGEYKIVDKDKQGN